MNLPQKPQKPYAYARRVENLQPGKSVTLNIQTDGDFDFLLAELNASVLKSDAAAGQTTEAGRVIPACRVTMTDTASQKALQDEPVCFDGVFGTAAKPGKLLVPHRIPARGGLNVNIINDHPTEIYTLNLAFKGVRESL